MTGKKLELKEIFETANPSTVDRQHMKNILSSIREERDITTQEIARLILYLADFPENNWDLCAIVETMKSNLEEINWRDVYSCFLDANFNIWSLDSLYVIIDCWVYISGIITVPYEIFFKRWKNERAQIYFIRLIIESDDKRTQLYSNVFFTKIIQPDESRNYRFKKVLTHESNFNCVELFQCIKMLDSKPLIDLVHKKSPEWCILGLVYIQPAFNSMFEDLMREFINSTGYGFVFYVLFRYHPVFMLNMFSLFQNQGCSLTRILDIILEQKMLPYISELPAVQHFCFDILILSSRRDHLNLSIWLNNSISMKKDLFIKAFIAYLIKKLKITSLLDSEVAGTVRDSQLYARNNNEIHDNVQSDLNHSKNIFLTKGESIKGDQDGDLGIKKHEGNEAMNKNDDKLFPLSIDMLHAITKILDQYVFKFDVLNQYNEFKSLLPAQKKPSKLSNANLEDQASGFISQLINSRKDIDESIEQLKDFVQGDNITKELANKIFSTLIENYINLHRLPNSDLIAIFYGELIKNRIFPISHLKIAQGYIKAGLISPETDREFNFAFKCLEHFLESFPSFLGEVEEIEAVKDNLVKKELILIDENCHTKLDIKDFFRLVFKNSQQVGNSLKDIDSINQIILANKNRQLLSSNITKSSVKDAGSCNGSCFSTEDKITSSQNDNMSHDGVDNKFEFDNDSIASKEDKLDVEPLDASNNSVDYKTPLMLYSYDQTSTSNNSFFFGNHEIHYDSLSQHIIQNLEDRSMCNAYYSLIQELSQEFKYYFVRKSLKLMCKFLDFSVENELSIVRNLGSFLGKLSLAQNKIVTIDTFDFKHFLIKSVECRRIFVGVSFICNYIVEGKYGAIFKPKNPWLMSILNLLCELHSCTLKPIRKEIERVFYAFNLPVVDKHLKSFKFKTKDYLVDYIVELGDPLINHVISLAIDFSIREISLPIIEKACSIAVQTVKEFNLSFLLQRNMLINLTKALCYVSAKEPIRACMSGNISYYLKLCGQEISTEQIYKIAFDNQNLCCKLIEKAGMSKMNDYIVGKMQGSLEKKFGALNIGEDVNTSYIRDINQIRGCNRRLEGAREVCMSKVNSHEPELRSNSMYAGFGDTKYNFHTKIDEAVDTESETGEKSKREANMNLLSVRGFLTNIDLPKHDTNSMVFMYTTTDHQLRFADLSLLDSMPHIEKISIKPVDSAEYQAIKSHFLAVGRKLPSNKMDFISEDWHLLFGPNAHYHFSVLLNKIEENEDKDEMCIKLCKYLIGHLLKTDVHPKFIYDVISVIFNISSRTQKEVLGWLIYSNDPRKFSVKLVSKFIEYSLVNMAEYDQALSKLVVSSNLDFVVGLLNNLVTYDVQICTVYDFVATLEALSNFSENCKVFDFFQKVSSMMMQFNTEDGMISKRISNISSVSEIQSRVAGSNLVSNIQSQNIHGVNIFSSSNNNNETLGAHSVTNYRDISSADKTLFTTGVSQFYAHGTGSLDSRPTSDNRMNSIINNADEARKYTLNRAIDLKYEFKLAWDHFIRRYKTPTPFCYQVIDSLYPLIKHKLALHLEESLEVFIEAYKKKNYLFVRLYLRFVLCVLNNIEDNAENRKLIYNFICVLVPSQVPCFTSSYLYLLNHRFMRLYIEGEECLEICREVLSCSIEFAHPVTMFFLRHINVVQRYAAYFSYLCPQRFPHLKNLFNSIYANPEHKFITKLLSNISISAGRSLKNDDYDLLLGNSGLFNETKSTHDVGTSNISKFLIDEKPNADFVHAKNLNLYFTIRKDLCTGKLFSYLGENIYAHVIDSLECKGSLELLKTMNDKYMEIALLLWIRRNSMFCPLSVENAIDEIFHINECARVIEKLNNNIK